MNLLLSAKVAKFLGVKPSQLEPVDNFGTGLGHWASFWRCEECAQYQDSEKRVFLVSNFRTCYSFVVNAEKGQLEGFVNAIFESAMRSFKEYGVRPPEEITLDLRFYRGQARRVTGFQNQLRNSAIHLLKAKPKYLGDIDAKLNRVPTRAVPEVFPKDAFQRMVAQDPPFCRGDALPENVVRMRN